jgi:1-acyl-sn-glycerol-3-phosphate acyltransferase
MAGLIIFLILRRYLLFIFMWFVCQVIFQVLNRVKITGRKNLPRGTGILYLSNHLTLIDSWLIAISVISFWELVFFPKRIPWNATARENFFDKWWRRQIFSLLRCIPVDRVVKTEVDVKIQTQKLSELLKEKNLILFFEGTRSRNGLIGPCKTGVTWTIMGADPIIVPIAIIGTQPIMPIETGSKIKFRSIRRGHRGEIRIGKPCRLADLLIDFDPTKDSHARAKEKFLAKKIQEMVIALQSN